MNGRWLFLAMSATAAIWAIGTTKYIGLLGIPTIVDAFYAYSDSRKAR
ncbi:MAG: hypothetical protein RMX68_032060 [Aulosira sp. ZfuVER01]|nr:hypothetical protein [Aulosira sp. ZfuVER01]MDZ8002372.1 hypothetical protein [Aulosira sp. DedVER01a]MDZ8052521.1 hypothetical protein [Aulosira sp. ZfuCHP01]